ncbi:hypothetical protein C7C46_23295 [Streptomyces tateyamensis]|uniref:Uncharacterized protein n=1 Tax=Streptomyces tateyamensis TaxID=565073 RepID=A0A2V4P120_9ACTN|nr:hypothetical protein [Streptomyces tateyamensis]PYC75809.1 hypothetical protein C7C46_23295 [Streptomyces tateyamensis]
MPRTTPPPTPYRPQLGELVSDLANNGVHGIYMGTLDERAYLRPAGGGVEWETDPRQLQRLPGERQLERVSRRSLPRDEACVQLPESSGTTHH